MFSKSDQCQIRSHDIEVMSWFIFYILSNSPWRIQANTDIKRAYHKISQFISELS